MRRLVLILMLLLSAPARDCLLAVMQAFRRAATRTDAATLRRNIKRLKQHEDAE